MSFGFQAAKRLNVRWHLYSMALSLMSEIKLAANRIMQGMLAIVTESLLRFRWKKNCFPNAASLAACNIQLSSFLLTTKEMGNLRQSLNRTQLHRRPTRRMRTIFSDWFIAHSTWLEAPHETCGVHWRRNFRPNDRRCLDVRRFPYQFWFPFLFFERLAAYQM